MIDEFKKHKYAKEESASMIEFRESLTTRFMISAKNEEILIKKNKTLLPEEKAEDIQFLKLLEANQPASLGPLDWKKLKSVSSYTLKNCTKYAVT